MQNYSKNGVGLVVLVLSLFGADVSDSMVGDVISAIGTLISFTLLVWNQVSRPDVDNFLFKKK